MRLGLESLEQVTFPHIINAVAFPPDEWGVTQTERIALAHFLHFRQAAIKGSLSA